MITIQRTVDSCKVGWLMFSVSDTDSVYRIRVNRYEVNRWLKLLMNRYVGESILANRHIEGTVDESAWACFYIEDVEESKV